jgi:PIN domain nuclease of toxin-antitoxin system
MERRVYLDTHIVVWLFYGEVERFSSQIKKVINQHSLYISEMVRLELQYLYEIKRVFEKPDTIINSLESEINLNRCHRPLTEIVTESLFLNWTRDPFDRMITATASAYGDILITKDKKILKHYDNAIF